MIEVTPRVVLIDTNNQVPYFLNTDQNNRLSGYISEGQISDSILTVEYNDADTTPAFRDVRNCLCLFRIVRFYYVAFSAEDVLVT